MPDPDQAPPAIPEAELDITGEVCPMTFVRTRLALDRLPPGARLRVRLRGAEPLRNVADSARALGHLVLAQPDDGRGGDSVLLITRR